MSKLMVGNLFKSGQIKLYIDIVIKLHVPVIFLIIKC